MAKPEETQAHFLQVVFNLPLHGPFTYALPRGFRRPEEEERASAAENGRAAAKAGSSGELVGRRVIAPMRGKKLLGFVVDTLEEEPEGDFAIKAVERFVDGQSLFGDDEIELARWIARMYFCSLGEALAVMIPGGKRETAPPEFPVEERAAESPKELSSHQQEALDVIDRAESGLFYLFGVTGSGKTEVFLQLAERSLAAGRGVIYLVPEISLTHQLVSHLIARFEGKVAVWHSRLTPSQKLEAWRKLRSGKVRFVLGARSAVFTPVRNLGLVVIDEEHENSYKSGSTPRYHARQVAMKRCAASRARLVMGSATPSAEAYHLMHTGTITKLELPERVAGGSMPRVELVSMQREQGAISSRLAEEIRQTHALGRQTILFLNRRGFSYFFHCRSCGFEMKCARCSVSLTLHKSSGRMVCHYCGYTRKPVDVCPECGSLDVGYSGFGTEKIEEEISALFPKLRVARVDTDSTRRKGSLEEILTKFRDGEYDLLLGTQMVAKGLNFPGVRLVGIVLADSTLNLPDFRAGERTFGLITQVAGRAGRYTDDGEVLVQTFKPGVPAVAYAARGELDRFYQEELESRRQLAFPPFYRIFRITVRGRDPEKVRVRIEGIAEELKRHAGPETQLLGPAACPIEVISRNHRHHLLLRTTSFDATHRAVRSWLAGDTGDSATYLELDVDPVNLL
jgi:primosomal protein N' (replication factor Y)